MLAAAVAVAGRNVGTHHDPFPVGCDHDHIAGITGWCGPGRIEAVEVDSGVDGQIFELAFPDPDAC